jgi:hypothetical protein
MYRSSAVVLVAAVVVPHSGCATAVDPSLADPRRQHLPPPPSEGLRSQLGTVELTGNHMQTALVFTTPAKGAGEGAARGAGLGAVGSIGVGAELGRGEGLFLGILVAPVAALVGAVAGAISAESAAKIEQQEKTFRVALEELRVAEVLSGHVADRLRERPSTPGGRVGSEGGTSTILEVVVEKVGLLGSAGIKPPLTFVLTERTRLIRASDGTELYGHWLTYRGRTRSLDAWLSEDAAMLREEAARACRELAERIVDEVFLLYLPGSERSDRR